MKQLKIYNCPQRSPEWIKYRLGHMTASHALTIATNGKGLKTYIRELMSEYYAIATSNSFINYDMQRGIDLEPKARELYAQINNVKVDEVGFIELDEYTGCSPDGLIGEDEGLECKAPKDKIFFDIILDGEEAIPKDYWYQCQFNLMVTGRKVWNLSFYNENYTNKLITFKIYPDKKAFKELRIGIKAGIEMINLIKEKIKYESI